MKQKLQITLLSCLAMIMITHLTKAQTTTKAVLFDGWIVAGYVDKGAYINCTGPSVKFTKKPVTILLGLLPGLRIKKDPSPAGSPNNSTVMPSLGFGLTAAYKQLALQLPLYYNNKTTTKDGKWEPGIGIGYKF